MFCMGNVGMISLNQGLFAKHLTLEREFPSFVVQIKRPDVPCM